MHPGVNAAAIATALLGLAAATTVEALELKAITRGRDGAVAYLLDADGRHLWAFTEGRRLYAHTLARIDDDSVHLKADPHRPEVGDVQLQLGPTTAVLPDAAPTDTTVSLDLRHDDPHHALYLLGAAAGEDLLVHDDVRTPVTLGVRRTSVEAARSRLIDGSGVCRRQRGAFAVYARCEDLPPEGPQVAVPRGEEITLEFVRGDLGDVMRLFVDISGFHITCPPELARRRITVRAHDRPWNEVLDGVLALYGYVWRVADTRLLLAPRRP